MVRTILYCIPGLCFLVSAFLAAVQDFNGSYVDLFLNVYQLTYHSVYVFCIFMILGDIAVWILCKLLDVLIETVNGNDH